jgi:hypothetical protein
MKLFNVWTVADGYYDRNYHVLAANKTEARSKLVAHGYDGQIQSVREETVADYEEMGMDPEHFDHSIRDCEAAGGIDLYDEGT